MMGRRSPALFVIYILIGLYILNLGMVMFKIPESLSFLNKGFMIGGGILIILSSFRWLRDRYNY